MFTGWRHAYVNIALTGGNLVFLLVALQNPTRSSFTAATGLIGITSLLAWYLNLRRFRSISDTPTAKIASAPQGYIEVLGQGCHLPGEQLKSHLTGLPCLWYRYRIEHKNSNRKWQHHESGESDDTFGLDDGTGMILVDPDQAEIITSSKQTWFKGEFRYTEWSLIEGNMLYVLGNHITLGGATEPLDFRADVSALLSEWKIDRHTLLKRFDQDKDGQISLDEWEQARLAAQRAIESLHREIRLQEAVHLIRKTPGKMFLIADRTPEQLASRYRIWAWTHLGILFSACAAAGWVLAS